MNVVTPDPEKVLNDVELRVIKWDKMASRDMRWVVSLGILSILSSLFVTSFAGSLAAPYGDFIIKGVSFLSAASITSLTAFRLVERANNFRFAWRKLLYAKHLYLINEISITELAREMYNCETSLGGISFGGGNQQDLVGRVPLQPLANPKPLEINMPFPANPPRNGLDGKENDEDETRYDTTKPKNI
ncbi:hypothetical protein ACVWYF_000960 [Hymenobacter sp. UYAg731]